MLAFLTASANLPFTVALAIMLLMAIIEGLGVLFGIGTFDFLDDLLPDVEAGVDSSEAVSVGFASKLLGWLHFGRVPVLILLVVLLTAFGTIGLSVQSVAASATGLLLPAIVVAPLAFLAALPVVRGFGGWLARVLPRDESSAVPHEDLVGRIAVLTLGDASSTLPAEGKVRDRHGSQHYVRVVPDLDDEVLREGEPVLLVRFVGPHYRAIRNTSASLTN